MSMFAQPVMKLFSCMLSLWWNMFRICSASDGIRSTYAQHILNDDFEMGWGFKVWKSTNMTQKDFFKTFSRNLKSAWNSAFFYTHIDIFQEKKFLGHNSTFCNLKMQMRKKNCTFSNILQKVKTYFFANIYHSPCDSYWNSKKSIKLKPPTRQAGNPFLGSWKGSGSALSLVKFGSHQNIFFPLYLFRFPKCVRFQFSGWINFV